MKVVVLYPVTGLSPRVRGNRPLSVVNGPP